MGLNLWKENLRRLFYYILWQWEYWNGELNKGFGFYFKAKILATVLLKISPQNEFVICIKIYMYVLLYLNSAKD